MKQKKLVTKRTDELMFGWKLSPIGLSGYVARKYYYKYGFDSKELRLQKTNPLDSLLHSLN